MSRFGLGFVSGVIPPSLEFLSNAGNASG